MMSLNIDESPRFHQVVKLTKASSIIPAIGYPVQTHCAKFNPIRKSLHTPV